MDDTQRRALLRIARSAIESELSGRPEETESARLSGLTAAENQSGAGVRLGAGNSGPTIVNVKLYRYE